MGNPAGGAAVSDTDDLDARIVDMVDKHGHFVMAVFDPDHAIPDFAYSIGFPQSIGQGEVLISGLDLDLMKALVHDTYDLCREGFTLEDHARTSELFSSFDCVVREVAEEFLNAEFLTPAQWYSQTAGGKPVTSAYQLVWPDKDGIFPWEEGFSPDLAGAQLELWRKETVN